LYQQKADLLNCDWPGRTGCLVLQLGSGAQESMTHGSVPAEASFFFSILYLLVQGSGVFIFFSCFYNASCFYISYSVFHSIVLSTHKRYSQDMLKFCESTVCTIYSVYLTFQKARKCVAKKPQPVYWSTGTCVPTKEHWLLYTAPIYYL